MVKSKIKVLLVEDSPSDAKLIKHELGEDQGYSFEVIWVSRVDKAIAELKRQQFDVALLDLTLPDSDGLATFTRIHATCPQQLPIIILTGTGNEQIGIEAIGLGAQDYLIKGSADSKSIIRAIRYAIERKQADVALGLSEEKFAKAFATNPAAIAMTQLEDGLFLEVNDTWVSLNGYSRDEVIGQSARKLPIWPTAEAANRFVQELREKGALRGWEQKFRNKSGGFFVAQLSAQVLTIHGERVILSTMVDITERKKMEEALQKSHDELERRVEERTVELQSALSEIQTMKDQLEAENIYFRQEIKTRSQYVRQYNRAK